MKVVLDCANGAAGAIAPDVFERLGAEVSVMAHHPNGLNINRDCGSTHPKGLSKAVIETRADLGLAFDGDADRVLAVDSTGQVVDGDHLLALFALDLRDRDGLASDTVVVTVMTNLGFHQAMDRAGIRVAVTGVGDRLVLEAMEEGGYSLGGEQSGHVIFRRLATTGDGVLTGSILADLLVRSGATLDAAAQAVMIRLPQELVNVAVNEPVRLAQAGAVWAAVSAAEAELAGEGRVLLRASGTEPLVRVMVEAATTERARSLARHLAGVVESELS
ncbi:MAG: phosphoglucosamine mutase, partial [Acidimicrobiales bacterium]